MTCVVGQEEWTAVAIGGITLEWKINAAKRDGGQRLAVHILDVAIHEMNFRFDAFLQMT